MDTTRRNHKRAALFVLGLLALLLATGCQTTHTDYAAFLSAEAANQRPREYRIEPPDVILITSKRVREIDGHTEIVRPDGRITLPLLGSIEIAGKTPESISAELQSMAREYYEDADVTLRVTGYNSKKIFVFGEVSVPGAVPWRGTNTVLRTLAVTQPTRLADPSKIQILRPNKDGKLVKRMTIDLNRMVQQGIIERDAVLQDGDIIYVPPTPLAAMGFAAQQLLLPIQPAAATVAGPANIAADLDTQPYGSQEAR